MHIGWCPAASSGRRGEREHVDASEDGAAGGEAKVVAEALRGDKNVAASQVSDEVIDGVASVQGWESDQRNGRQKKERRVT